MIKEKIMGKMLDVKGRKKKVHKSILPYLLLSMCISILFFIPAVHAGPVGITILTEDGGRVDWSHKHNLIAFDRMGSDGYFDIWVMKPDGSEQRCLTCSASGLPQKHIGNPVWHPDGDFIVFQAQKANVPSYVDNECTPGSGVLNDLWVMTADGTWFKNLYGVSDVVSDDAQGVLHPHFSHDGDTLIWSERVRANGRAFGEWVMKEASFTPTIWGPSLTGVKDINPSSVSSFYETHSFSPLDRHFLFTGNQDGGLEIYQYDRIRERAHRLTYNPFVWDEHAHYTRDGTQIVWASSRGLEITDRLKTEYWIMDRSGWNKTQLTYFNTPGHTHELDSEAIVAGDSSWGPDGRKFAAALIYADPTGPDHDRAYVAIVDLDPAPPEFTALYEELSSNLSKREAELRADWDGTRSPVIFSTTLLTADSNAGPSLLNPDVREGNRRYLKALADLGVKAVVMQINYPLLTQSFTVDAAAYLTAYAEMADEVRALGLKVIVEHNILLPGFSALDPTAYYKALTKSRYGQESYGEIRAIVEEVKPDYLSLVTEPETFEPAMKLHLSVADWTLFVEGVVDQLSVDVPRHTTKLGAGSGVWEDPAYVTSFAAVTGLDYIDIHSYPLTEGVTDYLKNLETWPAVVRAINPSLEIISSESWLYKAQAVELGGPPVNAALLSRDVYSFWEPLDNQYLEVLAITAHKENYSIVAPFWSNYFFAYLDYNDPSLAGLDPMELYDRAYSAAYQAVLAGQTTGLGRAYGEIAAGVSP